MNDPFSSDGAGFTEGTNPNRSLREQVWSPLQNTALWFAWWLHDAIGADDLLDALREVQGVEHQVIRDGQSYVGAVELLRQLRQATDGAPIGVEERPLVTLLLAGDGQAPALPADGLAYEAVRASGAGILLPSEDAFSAHVLVPRFVDGSMVQWRWFEIGTAVGDEPRRWLASQATEAFSPGEADEMLREAMENSARLIYNSGYSVGQTRGSSQGFSVDKMRLKIGALTDAFGLPGLPPGVATRSARLMARADTVSAIIDVARGAGVGASGPGYELDPHLFPLLRAVRAARITAVDYAQRELVR